MGYVRTAGMSTAARRRRQRAALVLTALLLTLLAVGAYAVAYYQGWLPSDGGGTADDARRSTAAPTAEALLPEEVTVNVYNATERAGLAGRTGEALEARGFQVDAVANDPERAEVTHAADIRHGPTGLEAAELLATLVPDAELVPDERDSAEVDLVLGEEFEELPAAQEQTGGSGDG